MPIDSAALTQRLINMATRHQQPPEIPYHLERFEPESLDEGLRWMRDRYDEQGVSFWLPPGDQTRRSVLKHWLWLRYAHRREIEARGLP